MIFKCDYFLESNGLSDLSFTAQCEWVNIKAFALKPGQIVKIKDTPKEARRHKPSLTGQSLVCLQPTKQSSFGLLLRKKWFPTEKEWACFSYQSRAPVSNKSSKLLMMSWPHTSICAICWPQIVKHWSGPRERGKEDSRLTWSGVVPVCTELEDGLLWICFPLGIRAGAGLASGQPRY